MPGSRLSPLCANKARFDTLRQSHGVDGRARITLNQAWRIVRTSGTHWLFMVEGLLRRLRPNNTSEIDKTRAGALKTPRRTNHSDAVAEPSAFVLGPLLVYGFVMLSAQTLC